MESLRFRRNCNYKLFNKKIKRRVTEEFVDNSVRLLEEKITQQFQGFLGIDVEKIDRFQLEL